MSFPQVEFPQVSPDWEGSHYCDRCLWEQRLPNKDKRHYLVRWSSKPFDNEWVCTAHLDFIQTSQEEKAS